MQFLHLLKSIGVGEQGRVGSQPKRKFANCVIADVLRVELVSGTACHDAFKAYQPSYVCRNGIVEYCEHDRTVINAGGERLRAPLQSGAMLAVGTNKETRHQAGSRGYRTSSLLNASTGKER